MPRVYSVDADGNEYNFLADYYRTTQEIASNVFRKGYQWPFHATRMFDYGSSLVDIAVHRESQKGRKVYLDFLKNIEPGKDGRAFSMDELDSDVYEYLNNNQANLSTPLERLDRLNPLAIKLYQMNGRDVTCEPLEFAINNQHMNGGIEVDTWGRTNIEGCYAIGEVAGTHGVTRPGGAALNSGQVFARRAATHISQRTTKGLDYQLDMSIISEAVVELTNSTNKGGLAVEDIKQLVQSTMSDKAGFICDEDEIATGLAELQQLNTKIRDQGIYAPASRSLYSVQWRQNALAAQAIMTALNHYVKNGGGSRGARAICNKNGGLVPDTVLGPLSDLPLLPEQDKDKDSIIRVLLNNNELEVSERNCRELQNVGSFYFEKNWMPWLTGEMVKNS
jgi:succinate dehydrogenase/fumarate reductase flavoprotein subunit